MTGTAYITNTIVASHTIGIAANDNSVVESHNLFADVALPYFGAISSGGNSITGTADFHDTTAYTLGKASLAVDMGVNSGVDLDSLLAVAVKIPAVVGHDVAGQIVKAGKTMLLHMVPEKLYEA